MEKGFGSVPKSAESEQTPSEAHHLVDIPLIGDDPHDGNVSSHKPKGLFNEVGTALPSSSSIQAANHPPQEHGLVILARRVAGEARTKAALLCGMVRSRKYFRRRLRILSFGASILSLARQIIISPIILSQTGPIHIWNISLADKTVGVVFQIVTALILLGTALYYYNVGGNTPERMTDYRRFLTAHANAIERVLANHHNYSEAQMARLEELIRVAQMNLSDLQDDVFVYGG